MSVDRIKRVNEEVRRALSGALTKIGQSDQIMTKGFLSIVSVTVSSDLRNATVIVSFMPFGSMSIDEKMKNQINHFLDNHRIELQRAIADTVSLKYTPRLHFKLTNSIEKGSNVLDILSQLDSDPSAPQDVD